MSIATTIESMGEHIKAAYRAVQTRGGGIT